MQDSLNGVTKFRQPDPAIMQLICAGMDCKIHVLDLFTRSTVAKLSHHSSTVTCIDHSPDYSRMVSSSRDKLVIVWDTSNWTAIRKMPVLEPVESVLFLPQDQLSALNIPHTDDHHVLTAGSQGTLKVWNTTSGRMVYHQEETPMKTLDESENENITKAVYVPALKSVMVATADRMILFFKLDNGLTLTKQMVGYWGPINCVRFLGPNSEFLALASSSSTVAIHHVDTFQCQLLTGHSDLVLALDVFPTDPCLLVSAGKWGGPSPTSKSFRQEINTIEVRTSLDLTDNNHRAERKLKLFINNSQITHSEHPKYLGIHLDRTLTFKTHLTKLKGKLSSRNNILHKLAGSSWGSDANTLRTSALALIFSTAEYCAPVWEGSCHTKLIDTQLNSTLRIITGVCQPTRIDWLPVLAHISPPELRRKEATKKMYQKLLDSPDLEINPILQSPPKHRLKSRNPIWSRGNQLLSQNFNISEAWSNSWISSDIPNKNLITSPSVKIPGFSLPRREWVLLNRFRTGQGRCAELMKLWGYTKDPNCACNVPQSMSHILDDCPLYKFNGGISNLHSVTPEALNWLKDLPLRL
ncbi:hypothetical protein LAZ67_21000390 [Cordylochernes scorpioides]|uniref:Uncharacterized protein n=1 Tax=Cordylochernes scorpioides TaxID=51811 RepID=A0ABY6LLI1_9ARAC|nr:hypothetical protein LAZ67_21000390 [Cordylochernes scorpioides]